MNEGEVDSPAPQLFGTDGIRARFGDFPLDRDTVHKIGIALGRRLGEETERPIVVIGGDTRESTSQTTSWLAAGLRLTGTAIRHAGVIPTPGISFLVEHLDADAGIAVSASHNPWHDNGIKMFDSRGFKWSREAEIDFERRLNAEATPPADTADQYLPPEPELLSAYSSTLSSTLSGDLPLAGLRVVLDTANGATAPIAEQIFRGLGATVRMFADNPNGRNINNNCGSTHPESLTDTVRETSSHIGIAFDGDGDRAVFADERGQVRDGDDTLYLWATDLHADGGLVPPEIVATTMSNLGLERALNRRGIGMPRSDVGDRNVVEIMLARGLTLGGEQSGHIIHLGSCKTGDGLRTGLRICEILQRAERPFSTLLTEVERYPQILLNVVVTRKPAFDSVPAIANQVDRIQEALGDEGRLVLRYSGTEPLARVMIEGRDGPLVDTLARKLAGVIDREIGELATGRESGE